MTQLSLGVSVAAGPVQDYPGKRSPDKDRPVDPALGAPVIVSVSLSSGASAVGDIVAMIVLWEGAPTPTLEHRWRRDGVLVVGADDAVYETTAPGLLVGEARALNGVGETAWVASPPLAVAASAPLPMSAPTVIGGIGQATLAFAAAPADGGSPVDLFGYEVATAGDAVFATPVAQGTQIASVPDVVVSPLAAGDYIARTRARNAMGWAAWSQPSAPASVSVAATVPAAMDAPSVEALSGTALRATRAPAPTDGGSGITSYDLRHSPDSSSWLVVSDVAAVHDLTSLPNGATRFVQTRAVNAVGWGPWSPSADAATWTAPIIQSVHLSSTAPVVEQIVAATTVASGDPAPTLAYRWLLDGELIAGAEAASYETAAAGALVCEVRATNALDQTPWIASDVALVQAAVTPPEPLVAADVTLEDARAAPSGVYLWTAAQAEGITVEATGPNGAPLRDVPALWSFHPAPAATLATMNLRRSRDADEAVSASVARTATPTLGSDLSYSVFRDTLLTRAAQGVVWGSAGTNAANARTALWGSTPYAAVTLASGSVVTPAADGGLTHDADAVAVADGAATTETFTVMKGPTRNAAASTSGGWLYVGGVFATTDITLSLAGRTITKTAGAGIRTYSMTLFTTNNDQGFYLKPGDTMTISITGNCTASGTFGAGIQGGVSDADGNGTDYFSTGGESANISTGAFTYTGTVTVPPERTVGQTGHALRLKFGSSFAGTIDLDAFSYSVPLYNAETVTAQVLGGAAPNTPPGEMAAPSLAADGLGDAAITLAAAPAQGGSSIDSYDWQTALADDAAFADPIHEGSVAAANRATPITVALHDTAPPPDQALSYNVAMTALDLAPHFPGGAASGPFALVAEWDAIIAGLSLNASTGVISGTPTDRRGRGWHYIRVANAAGRSVAVRMCSAPDITPANYAHVFNAPTYDVQTNVQNLTGDVLILNPVVNATLVLRGLTGGIVTVAGATVNVPAEDGIRFSSLGATENVTIWGGTYSAGFNCISVTDTGSVRHTGVRILNARLLASGASGGPVNHHGVYCKAPNALIEGVIHGPGPDYPSAAGAVYGSGVSMRAGGVVRGCIVRRCADSGIGYFANSDGDGLTMLWEQNDVDDVNRGGGVDSDTRGAMDLLAAAGDAPVGNFVDAVTIRNNAVAANAINVAADYAAQSVPVTQTGNAATLPDAAVSTGYIARSRAVSAAGAGPWSSASASAITALTLLPADFTLLAGSIEDMAPFGLAYSTLRAPGVDGGTLDARRTLTGIEPGAYRIDMPYHDEADGPGVLELYVGDVLCASRQMTFEPTGDLAPTAANLVTWTIPAVNLRPGDVLRVVCREASGEPGRIRSVTLTRVGPVDPANAPDTPLDPPIGDTSLTGSGALDLGEAISHYTIDGPQGSATIRGYTLAGFEASNPQLASAHIYTVTSLATTDTLGTLRHALKAGSANAQGVTAGPRLVVFSVSGVIATGNFTFDCTRTQTWVNGHIAPGPIVITGAGIKVRYSTVQFEGVYFQPGPPTAAGRASDFKGVSFNRFSQTGDPNVQDCGVVQCAFFNGVDEAPSTYVGGTGAPVNIVRPVFADNTISHAYRAPNLSSPWNLWHETQHNYGTLIGHGTWNAFIAECVHAGCDHRSPVGTQGTTMIVYGCFTHDVNPTFYRPIQLYDTTPPGAGAAFGGAGFPLLAPGTVGFERHVTAIGNYFEPGALSRLRAQVPTAYINERNISASVCRLYGRGNRFDDTFTAGQFEGPLGPNNTAPAIVPATYRVVSPVPLVWPDRLPTHPSETRAWTLAHAGPRPSNRAAVPLFNTYMSAIAAQRAKAWASRDKLYLESPAAVALGTLGTWTAPTLPANPWTVEANGFLRIVNWMHQLRRDLGGTPFGNVDRPVTTWVGGKLTVTAAGVVTWDASDADAGHAPITLRCKTVAGEDIAVTINAA